MAWIEVHDTLREHHKTYALAATLKLEQYAAVGLMVSLWTWAINHAPDGDLSKFPPAAIASACHWKRKPDVLLEALKECGYVTDTLQIHDWYMYAGKLIDRREANAKRNREARARSASRDTHERITSASRDGATVPNLTVPNLTVPNRGSTDPGDKPPAPPLKPSKPSKPARNKYGQYQNVLLTEDEYTTLAKEFPIDGQERIERLSEYIASKGVTYKNHLATIRAWARKDKAAPVGKRVGFQAYDKQADHLVEPAVPDLLAEARNIE